MDVEWLTLETAQVMFLVSLGALLLIFAGVAVVELVTNRKPKPEPKEPVVMGLYAYRTDDPFEAHQSVVRIVEAKRNAEGVLFVQYVYVKEDGTDYGSKFSREWSEFLKLYRPV